MNSNIKNRNIQSINLNDFINNFIDIFKIHQSEGRASAFALIIYDFNNPHLSKIVQDKDYWLSLNRLTGQYLTIFSLIESEIKNKINTNVPKNIRLKFEAVKVETKSEVSIGYKQIVEMFFGDAEFKTPSILFFQVKDNCIANYFFIELIENKIEEGFIEIQEVIKESIDSIKQITPDNKENYIEIFNMIEINVNGAIWWKKRTRLINKLIGIINFLAILK